MEKIEGWKCRFLSTSCELKHLLGEVSGGGFPNDLIYTTLDNCKQLMEDAVETVCFSRFKIHSIELVHMDAVSNAVLRTTLDDVLSSLWCSLQATNSSFDAILDQMLLEGRLTPYKGLHVLPKQGERISSLEPSSLLKLSDEMNTSSCKKQDYGDCRTLLDEDESSDGRDNLSSKKLFVLKGARDSEVVVKLQEDDEVENERLSNITNKQLPDISLDKSDDYCNSISSHLAQDIFPTESDESAVPNPPVNKLSRDMGPYKHKRRMSTVAKNCDVKKQDQTKSSSLYKRSQTFVNKAGRKSSKCKTRVVRTSAIQGGKKVSHTINFLVFKCFLCEPPSNCIYNSFRELTSHISSVHSIADESRTRVLKCSRKSEGNCLWSKRFQDVMDRDQVAYSLNHLILNHNMAIPEYVQPFRCPFPSCTYQAVRKFSIDSHLSTHDTELVPCAHCGKMLKKKSMHLHRMFCEVIGLKVKPNICPVENCDKSFKSKYSLLNHIKANHENIKAYQCSGCDKGFVNKSDHACHMFACHGVNVTGHKAYHCPVCNFSTVAKAVFRRHVMRLHPKLWPLIEGRKTRDRDEKAQEELELAAVDLLRNRFRDQMNEAEEVTNEPLLERRDVLEKISMFGEMRNGNNSPVEKSSSSFEQFTIKRDDESNQDQSDILDSKDSTNLRLTDDANKNAAVKLEDEDTIIESEQALLSRLTNTQLQEIPGEDSEQILSQTRSSTRNVLHTGSERNQTAVTTVTEISRSSVSPKKHKRKISAVADDNDDKPLPPNNRQNISLTENDNKSSERRKSLIRTPTIQGGKKVSHSINFLSYKCFLCEPPSNCIYNSFKELAIHISSVHSIADKSGRRTLHCCRESEGNCLWSKSFEELIDRDQVSYSLTHLILNHNMAIPEYIQPFRCPFPSCTYQAVRKFSIDSHLSTHDTELVPCVHCGKMLKKKSMHLHRMFCEVIGLKVKPNVCPMENCDKSFKSKYSLLNHIKANHENIKAYQCLSCKKGFVNKSDYACHMFACHGVNVTGYKAYNCPICNFSTVAKTLFRKHVMKVHPKLWQIAGKDRRKSLEKTQEELENAAADLLKNLISDLEGNYQVESLEIQPKKPTDTDTIVGLGDIKLDEEKQELCQEIEKQEPKLSGCEDNSPANGLEAEQSSHARRRRNRRNNSMESTEETLQMTDVDTRAFQIKINVAEADFMLNCTNSSETEEDDEDGKSVKTKSSSSSSSHAMNLTRLQCFLCPCSDLVFQSITLLYSHIKDAHSVSGDDGRAVLECPECSTRKQLKRHGIDRDLLARLLNHLIVKHKWNVPEFVVPYYCSHPDCGFFSIQLRNLTAHLRRHTEQEKVPCDKCGKFLNPLSFREHSISCAVSVEERRVFRCTQCDKTFTKKQGLENHVRIKHENIKNFLCSHCTMRFGSGRELEEHAFNLHRINPRNKPVLTCPQCPFVTIKVARFDKHCKYVHVKVREHSCPVCNKRFKTTGQLRNHMQGHNEKSFKCHLCDFCTARKQNLHEHIQAQHIRKQFKCEFCDYVTGYMANLHKHMRITCRKKQHAFPNTQ